MLGRQTELLHLSFSIICKAAGSEMGLEYVKVTNDMLPNATS